MRPEQKIILSARQTGECAERLLEWLDQSRQMLKAQGRGLRVEVQNISRELLSLVEAVEQPATAGIMGSWGSARAEIVAAMMSDAQTAAADDETRLVLSRERLLTLVPGDHDGGATASLRFVAAERAEGPYRFPIQMKLFGQLDLVKILASGYLVHVPPQRQRLIAPEVVAHRLTVKAQEVVNQAFSGLSRSDVDAIRDTLHALAPESKTLRDLDAAGYWETLGGLAPHLPEALRRQAFAILWGDDPALTALFDRLSNAIELMGFSGEAFTGLEALTGRDPVTGWIVRHEDSLVAALTLSSCHDRPERTIRVSSRHGRATDVERFVLAALIDEARLPIDLAALPLLETADILALPSLRPVLIWPRSKLETGSSKSPSTLTAAEALEIFIAQKASYQLVRAVRQHALTSLTVSTVVGNDHELDAASSAAVADWIEATQGDTAHARERRRTGLCILAAEPDKRTAGAFTNDEDGDTRLTSTIEAVLDGNSDWAQEWTPNRSFRNIFTWHPPHVPHAAAARPVGPGSADILHFARARPADGGIRTADLGGINDLGSLVHAVTQATTATIHLQQLSARLGELRRALSARFLRLHSSNDPLSVIEWRRQICHVARNRLQRAAQDGDFGRLQQALMFSESEAAAVLARLKVEDPRYSATMVPDLRTLDPARIVEGCLSAWITGMRQMARAPGLMRAVHVPGTVAAHMVDELVLGGLRIGLQEKLSEAVRRIQLSAVRAVDCEHSVAALMERGINAYVEALDPGARSGLNPAQRDTRFGMGMRGAGRNHSSAAVERAPNPSPSAIADDWAETFAELIEANILGASLLGGAGHLNRELGDVLNTMSASPFEVFQ